MIGAALRVVTPDESYDMQHDQYTSTPAILGGPYEAIESERLTEALESREIGSVNARLWAVAHFEGDSDAHGKYPWECLTHSQRVRAFQEISLALAEGILAEFDAQRFPHRYNRRMIRMVRDLQLRYAHIVCTGEMPTAGYDLDDPDEDAPPREGSLLGVSDNCDEREWDVDYGPAQRSGEFRIPRDQTRS